jgi:hypothetical protein
LLLISQCHAAMYWGREVNQRQADAGAGSKGIVISSHLIHFRSKEAQKWDYSV